MSGQDRKRRVAVRKLLALAALASGVLAPAVADAQQDKFYLDRLQIGGAPDDTFALWRPQMGEKTRFFGQLAVGFAFRPLRTEDVIADPAARATTKVTTPVNEQLSVYLNAGVEILDRFSLQVGLPITAYEHGDTVTSVGPQDAGAVNDMRLDSRFILFRTTDRFFKLGLDTSLFFPTGNRGSYGSDGSIDGLLELSGELDFKKFFIVADTGPLFRPHNAVDDGVSMANSIQTQSEWRYGIGGFVPIRNEQFRLGLQLFGSVQMGAATFKQNDPLEWMAEGRMNLDKRKQGFVAVGGGTRIFPGYSPDFRIIAAIGYNFGLADTNPGSPGKRWRASQNCSDRDHDGICDDIDLCPDEPEDHKPPNPDDGCPALPDRDGDGIPDISDKCPDQPEDFDGIQDADGCPEDDADHDGIPDAQDACPMEPGDPDPDPSKNGCPKYIRRIKGSSEIQILQQIQFETGSAVIKKDSYKILDEVVRLLKVNPEITLLSIEGHTDNRGSDELNDKLSKARAKSCVDYLESHGIEPKRLTSSGYGPKRPIDTNDTAEGRQKNRRTEFHIRNQEGGTPVQGAGGTPPPKGAPAGGKPPAGIPSTP